MPPTATRILTYGVDVSPAQLRRLSPIGVSGSRNFRNLSLVAEWVKAIGPCALIVGDAAGVDTVVSSVAEQRGGYTVVVVPFRSAAGKAGGLLRNPDVARYAGEFVCFWSGLPSKSDPDSTSDMGSTGAAHAAMWALVYGKPLVVYLADGSHVQTGEPIRATGFVSPRHLMPRPLAGQPVSPQ